MSASLDSAELTSASIAPEHHGSSRGDIVRITVVGLAVIFCWLRIWEPLPKIDLIGLIAVLAGGYPIYREAIADILSRRMTMELSMTLALAAALIIGEVFTALVIVFFVLIAEALEKLTVGRGRQAIRDLLAVTARPEVISFAGGLPAPEYFPLEVVRESFDRVLRTEGPETLQYGPTEGYLPLRELLAEADRTAIGG